MPIESILNPFGSFRMGLFPPGRFPFGKSTYFDGTKNIDIAFEQKAPLYLIGDNVNGKLTEKNLVTAPFHFEIPIRLLASTDNLDFPFSIEGVSAARIFGAYRDFGGGNTQMVFGVVDAAGTTKYGPQIPYNLGDIETCVIDRVGTTLTIMLGGTTRTTTSLDLSAGFTLNEIILGAEKTTSSRAVEGLFGFFKSDIWGDWNLNSNQDDGIFFTSTKGEVLFLDEDNAGESQIPGTGFTWPVDTLFNQPLTDALRLNNDSITTVLSTRRTGLENGFRFGKIFRSNLSTATGQFLFEYTDSIDSSKIEGSVGAGNVIVSVYDSNGTIQFQSNSPIATALQIQYLDVEFLAGVLTVRIDGVAGSVLGAGTLAAGLNINTMEEGARGAGDNITYDLFQTFGPTFPKLILSGRLWTQTDPNGNTFTDDEGNVWTFTDGTPKDAVTPNIGEWNNVYLISDTPVDVESGSPEIVIVDNLAQWNILTGTFEFIISP